MDTLILIIGGYTQVLVEQILDDYPVEDWDYFISGLNEYFGDAEHPMDEWGKFIHDNYLLGRLLRNIQKKFGYSLRKFIDRRILELVSDGYNRSQIIFDISILPDPLTDLYLLSVKSNVIAGNSGDFEFMLLN